MPKKGLLISFLYDALYEKKYPNLIWLDRENLKFALLSLNKRNKNRSQLYEAIYEDWHSIKHRSLNGNDKTDRLKSALKKSEYLNYCKADNVRNKYIVFQFKSKNLAKATDAAIASSPEPFPSVNSPESDLGYYSSCGTPFSEYSEIGSPRVLEHNYHSENMSCNNDHGVGTVKIFDRDEPGDLNTHLLNPSASSSSEPSNQANGGIENGIMNMSSIGEDSSQLFDADGNLILDVMADLLESWSKSDGINQSVYDDAIIHPDVSVATDVVIDGYPATHGQSPLVSVNEHEKLDPMAVPLLCGGEPSLNITPLGDFSDYIDEPSFLRNEMSFTTSESDSGNKSDESAVAFHNIPAATHAIPIAAATENEFQIGYSLALDVNSSSLCADVPGEVNVYHDSGFPFPHEQGLTCTSEEASFVSPPLISLVPNGMTGNNSANVASYQPVLSPDGIYQGMVHFMGQNYMVAIRQLSPM